MIVQPKNKAMILGCERSGSTWLANIFDSHPDVELMMEPFADYTKIFPEFPDRNVYLANANPKLIKEVEKKYQHLPNIKYQLTYKPNKNINIKHLDRFIIRKYQLYEKLFGMRIPLKIEQYILLNLNTSILPIYKHFKKNSHMSFQVTKELRLNFKVGVLSDLFPASKYLVIIRHPGAQLTSILNLFKKHTLQELKISLALFIECVKSCNRFKKYENLIEVCNWESDLEVRLILWWLINYDVLIEDIKSHNLEFKIIYHETMSEKPLETICEIFNFCGLSIDKQVEEYIQASTKEDKNIKNPLVTTRKSIDYYKKAIDNVNKDFQKKIEDIISSINTIKEIKYY